MNRSTAASPRGAVPAPPPGPAAAHPARPFSCRPGCAACCEAPSISSPLPGLPHGKPAGVVCPALERESGLCTVWGGPEYPPVCRAFTATPELCGATRAEALDRLARLERLTAPDPPEAGS